MLTDREWMLPSYSRKLNGSRVSNALVAEQIALFAKHIAILCDFFKSIKAWKTIDLVFVKHEHGILEFIKCPISKEEKPLTLHA